ncbi:esterase-like activity of phytase family protein [Paeniglutamicibacter sp. MACA_103]|uniref:esterase-like activity of phytase family protein n=1 Tax=Paeniglutamicibacter sp. MACA_103 TaxID=3377337 RepID=UPI0038964118
MSRFPRTRRTAAAVLAGGLSLGLLPALAAPAAAADLKPNFALEYVDSMVLPASPEYFGAPFGGISGLDYVAREGHFLAQSDDRSQHAPARFYELVLPFGEDGFDEAGFAVKSRIDLLDANGETYAAGTIDPESIRYDKRSGTALVSDEGDARQLIAPALRETTLDGELVREYEVPAEFVPAVDANGVQVSGVRNNQAFENLSLSRNGKTVSLMTEGALVQDGPLAGPETGSPLRLTQLDRKSGGVEGQFIYEVEAMAGVEPGAGGDRGAVEILQVSAHGYLVVERQYSAGKNSIQVFEASTKGATDVSGQAALDGTAVPMAKELLMDLEVADVHPDNVESISWGPEFADGSASLLLAADDNFSSLGGGTQRTTFHLLKVSEE